MGLNGSQARRRGHSDAVRDAHARLRLCGVSAVLARHERVLLLVRLVGVGRRGSPVGRVDKGSNRHQRGAPRKLRPSTRTREASASAARIAAEAIGGHAAHP
eukprot:1978097-Pleurochrysis_carterae.AAC.4